MSERWREVFRGAVAPLLSMATGRRIIVAYEREYLA
jgi:hypothetical protein